LWIEVENKKYMSGVCAGREKGLDKCLMMRNAQVFNYSPNFPEFRMQSSQKSIENLHKTFRFTSAVAVSRTPFSALHW